MDTFKRIEKLIFAIIIVFAILVIGNSSYAREYDADDYWRNFNGIFRYNWYTYKGNEYIMRDSTLEDAKTLIGKPTGPWYGDPNINWNNGGADFTLVASQYSNVQCIDPPTGLGDEGISLNGIIDINSQGNKPTSANIYYTNGHKLDYEDDYRSLSSIYILLVC